jgi:hypothetical protein
MHFALVFVGAPHKGKAPGRVTKQIVHRSFWRISGSLPNLSQSAPYKGPHVSRKPLRATPTNLVGGSHETTNP